VLAFGGSIDYFVETMLNRSTRAEAEEIAAPTRLHRL
jgi:hypothetical protein